MKNVILQIQESQRMPGKIKIKNTYTHHIQVAKNQRQRENIVGSQRKKVYYLQKNTGKKNINSLLQTHSPEDNGVTFSSAERKQKKSTQDSVSSRNTFQE